MNTYGQNNDFALVHTIPISYPTSVSVDRKGDFYIADREGNINKYNTEGEHLLNYSPQKIGEISLLESWFAIRSFAFYRDYQEYLFLDRFLVPSPVYTLPEDLIGFARIATVAIDDNIWIVDDADMSLKKLDRANQFLLLNFPLIPVINDPDHGINYIREYQNQLFINNEKEGIMVFDNLGNYKFTIQEKGLNFFSFADDEVCFLREGELVFINIYDRKKRSVRLISDTAYLFCLAINNRIILIARNHAEIYSVN
jgi:hypothetical protein